MHLPSPKSINLQTKSALCCSPLVIVSYTYDSDNEPHRSASPRGAYTSRMGSSRERLLEPVRDRTEIRQQLGDGRRLVACLCAAWCSSCGAWRDAFAAVAQDFEDDCFVWIDIEDHADLVADVEVETLPVLLVQGAGGVGFLGPVEPRAPVVKALLQRMANVDAALRDPGIRTALVA